MGGAARGEEWDAWDGVLDEDFVAGGRHEASAQERAARARRISAHHAWVVGEGLVVGPPARPRRTNSGRWAAAFIAALVLAVVAGTWYVARPGTRLGQAAVAPAGVGGFAFLNEQADGSGRPVTFDPCQAIHYVVRPKGQPPSGPAMLASALEELSRATGLVFISDGTTDEAPSKSRHLRGGRSVRGAPAPVLIAWATSDEWPTLRGRIAGEAGPVMRSPDGSPRGARYVTGQVVLDAEDLAHSVSDRAAAAEVRLVLLHELGHLVGLGHVLDRNQVMFSGSQGLAEYGPGDLRGLQQLGSGRCR